MDDDPVKKKRKRIGSEGYGAGSGGTDDAAEEQICGPESTTVQPPKKKTRIPPRRTSAGSCLGGVDGDGSGVINTAGVAHTRKERSRDGASDSASGGSNGELNEGGEDPIEPQDIIAEDQPEARTGVVVAYTPNMPTRYGHLLRNISFLLPYENQGRAFECPCNKINTFLRWSGCNTCLFFEWVEKDQKMQCQMLNPVTGVRVSFLVNPAFSAELLQDKVNCAVLSFSSNFCCDDTWVAVKNVLMAMFSPYQEDAAESPDHLYVFTRIDDSVYIRIMKIDSIPSSISDAKLVLSEVGSPFCLKLLDVKYSHGQCVVSDRVCDISQSQKLNMSFSPTECHTMPPDELGSCILHSVLFGHEHYMFLLESGISLSEFEGFSVSLFEFLEKESFLKTKRILGSKRNKRSTFVRNIGKSIIKSMLLELIILFSCDKCILMEGDVLGHSNILLKGSSVKFYGVKLAKYEENQAKENVVWVVRLIKQCFPFGKIPSDLEEMLDFLLEDPLRNLEVAKDDSCLLSAKERRILLVSLHTEYMTNVRPHLLEDRLSHNSFFSKSPYLNSWLTIVKKNRYLKKVANLETKKVSRLVKKAEEAKVKSMKMKKEETSVILKGELQFNLMRNSHVHIPEKARKDGFKTFRVSWSDYILTAYFWKYVSFIQKRIAPYLKSKREKSK